MKLKIEINMDNAAFHEQDSGPECARILRELASECDGGRISAGFTRRLNDINGKRVGMAKVTH